MQINLRLIFFFIPNFSLNGKRFFRVALRFSVSPAMLTHIALRCQVPVGVPLKIPANSAMSWLFFYVSPVRALRFWKCFQNPQKTKLFFAPSFFWGGALRFSVLPAMLMHIASRCQVPLGVPLKIPANSAMSWLFFYVPPRRDLRFWKWSFQNLQKQKIVFAPHGADGRSRTSLRAVKAIWVYH